MTKSPRVREMAYQTLVRPLAGVRFSNMGPLTQQTVHKIEMVQRRAARWTINDYNRTNSVTSLLHQLDWQTLKEDDQWPVSVSFTKS